MGVQIELMERTAADRHPPPNPPDRRDTRKEQTMKRTVLTLAASLSLVAGAALAQGTTAGSAIDLSTLSAEQLDALTSILAGLPRQ